MSFKMHEELAEKLPRGVQLCTQRGDLAWYCACCWAKICKLAPRL